MALPNPYRGSTISTQNTRAFIPQMWADMVLRNRDPKLIMGNACRSWPASGKGSVVHIPEFGDLAVHQRQIETPVTVQTLDPTDYTMKCDLEGVSAISIDDATTLFTKYNVRSIYMERQSYALRRDLDNRVLGMRAGLPESQHIWNTSNGAEDGTPLPFSPAAVLAGIEKLQLANVPVENIRLYIGIYQQTDLRRDPNIINNDYYPGYVIETGQVGEVYGVRTMVSNNIVPNSLTGYRNGDKEQPSPTPGVAGSIYLPTQGAIPRTLPLGQAGNEANEPFITALMCHQDWCLDARPIGRAGIKVTESFENLLQMSLVVSKQFYGHKIWRDDHAVLIHSAAKR